MTCDVSVLTWHVAWGGSQQLPQLLAMLECTRWELLGCLRGSNTAVPQSYRFMYLKSSRCVTLM
jgi:hypothetical protein